MPKPHSEDLNKMCRNLWRRLEEQDLYILCGLDSKYDVDADGNLAIKESIQNERRHLGHKDS